VNFVEYGSFVLHPINGYIAEAFLYGSLLCICIARCRDKCNPRPPSQLLGFENSGSPLSIKQLDRLLKDTIEPGSYQFLCKDVLANSCINEGAIAAKQQRCANGNLRKNSLPKQFSMAQASYLDEVKVRARAWGKRFEQTTAYTYRDLQEKIQTVVEKDTTENG
jgi:hypothetical protein